MEKNKEYIGEVLFLGSEGEGVIKFGDGTAFVPFCLVGEKVSFKALKVKDDICFGKLTEVHNISSDRVSPECPVYEKCGGCTLQHMSYRAQCEFKRQTVENCLKKLGGLSVAVNATVESDLPYGYRNKLAMPVGQNEKGETVTGFYAPRSHRIVPVNNCPLQRNWTKDVISALVAFMRDNGIEGYNEQTKKGVIRHIVGREIKDRYILTVVAVKKIDLTPLAKILEASFKRFTLLLNINSAQTNVIFGKEWHIFSGDGYFDAEDAGIKFRAGANTFLQVNDNVRTKLYDAAVKEVTDGNAAAIDLYSGGGMLTAMLAKSCKAAYGIEIVKEAVICADQIKQMNNLEGRMFNICGKVESKIDKVLALTEGSKRVIVCDPPRKGIERSVINAILKSGAEKIVLISCNPATLARDSGLLCGSLKEVDGQLVKNPEYTGEPLNGYYKIDSVTPFDMFPQTKHVETLVVLTRQRNLDEV